MQLWAETGIGGVIILFTCLFMFIKESHKVNKESRENQILVAASSSAIVALVTDSILSFPFHIVPSALIGVTAAGIALSITNQKSGDKL